jgi:di/tricarboxylate transporter
VKAKARGCGANLADDMEARRLRRQGVEPQFIAHRLRPMNPIAIFAVPMPHVDPAYIVLATLAGSVILFLTDALRYEVTAILVVLVLALTGCLSASEAFSGFSSPAVVVIASMYVFGHAFQRSGVAEAVSRRFLHTKSGSEIGLVFRLTLTSGLLSSVLSNTGVVATLMPVCSSLSQRYKVSVSRLLMPMAFGSLVGGMVTVIATTTNIAVNEVIEGHAGVEPFSVFEFSHLGLILLAVTCLYFIWPGRMLLSKSPVGQTLTERYQVPKFVTEVLIEPSSALINRSVADSELFADYDISVIGIVNAGGDSVMAPGPYNRIRADDTLILQGEPSDIVRMREGLDLRERSSVTAGQMVLYSGDVQLVESVIPAGSFLVGQTLARSEFRTRTGLNVLALAKHGQVRLSRIQNTVLEVGDTLLLQGHLADIVRARRDREVLVLDEIAHRRFKSRDAALTVATLMLVLLLASITTVNLAVLSMAGAVALVLTRVVRPEEISKVINWSVIALIGGMLALGEAFERYDLGQSVADWLGGLQGGELSPRVLLAVLMAVTVLLTQVLNHVSTAVIMTPVALSLASGLEFSDRPFLMAIVAGANFCYLSPVAHQANAMVMGPGGYRYRDFLRVGALLTLISMAISVWLIPIFWPL